MAPRFFTLNNWVNGGVITEMKPIMGGTGLGEKVKGSTLVCVIRVSLSPPGEGAGRSHCMWTLRP